MLVAARFVAFQAMNWALRNDDLPKVRKDLKHQEG